MALGELTDVEAMSQHELARRLGLEKSTVSRLAAALVDRGWVSRARNPDNRRLYRLQLTPDGQAAARQIGKELRARHTELLNGLTPAERHGLTIGLAGIARVLKNQH
jgi:DNA-binding MarR family transcriptional regulator